MASQEQLITEIVALAKEQALASGYESDTLPGPPTTEEQIAAAEQSRGRVFPARYREFLKLHDGWRDFSWGMQLYSTAELTGDAYSRGYIEDMVAEEDKMLTQRVLDALVIGWSEDDASLLLITNDGEVLDWRYEETGSHASFDALLETQAERLRDIRDIEARTKQAIEASWAPKARAKNEATLAKEIRRVLAKAPVATKVAPPKPRAKRPAAVKATALVARRKGKIVAEVTQHLVLYLGAYPSKDEVLASYHAFRKRFPVDGALSWVAAGRMFPNHGEVDDAKLEAELRVNNGTYGLRFAVDVPRKGGAAKYVLNVVGVPPTTDGAALPRASFCELIVPASEPADKVYALAQDLVAILPVRSGHGGYAAYVWDDKVRPDPLPDIFAWCRRFFGVDVGSIDGWLPGAVTRLHGASWLTILGPAFSTELARAGRMRFGRGVTIKRTKRAAIIRAGTKPSLGDVARGQFPGEVAAVERAIAPLLIAGYDARSWVNFAGNFFTTQSEDLLPMRSHHATSIYLARFIDPAGWLAPTPRERAETKLRTLCKLHARPELWTEWQTEAKTYIPSFDTLLRLLFNSTTSHTAADESVDALEFVTQFAEATPRAHNNLVYAYAARNELTKALALMPVALARAKDNPAILHNAACVFARTDQLARAMKCVEDAKEFGYDKMDNIRDDAELAALHPDPAWQRVFG